MGWFTRLFGRDPGTATPAPQSMETIRIVTAYAAALSQPRAAVTDAAKLPYPKIRIKQALITAIGLASAATMRAELKDAYLKLAEWQENTGAQPEVMERIASESRVLADEIRSLDA